MIRSILGDPRCAMIFFLCQMAVPSNTHAPGKFAEKCLGVGAGIAKKGEGRIHFLVVNPRWGKEFLPGWRGVFRGGSAPSCGILAESATKTDKKTDTYQDSQVSGPEQNIRIHKSPGLGTNCMMAP